MASVIPIPDAGWTVADLYDRFGPIPVARIMTDPAPGSATVEDVVRLDDHEDRLCELIDGVLVEKTVGLIESWLAGRIVTLLNLYLSKHELGIVTTTDGMLQLFPDQVRIPDASFITLERLKGSGWPDQATPSLAPDLAVEVISPSNTDREMENKLHEYFEAGTRLVWYVEPKSKTVTTYTAPDKSSVLTEQDTLTGGDVLPGLEIDLHELFQLPTPPANES